MCYLPIAFVELQSGGEANIHEQFFVDLTQNISSSLDSAV